MKAYLVRVGIDCTKPKKKNEDTGQFNAPVNLETGEFAYVPIKETEDIRSGSERTFKDFIDPCRKVGKELPSRLWYENTHLDPDFLELTYGDVDGYNKITGKTNNRGEPLRTLKADDLIVFYVGLEPIRHLSEHHDRLCYAIIGIFRVKESIPARDFYERGSGDKNAHTRRLYFDPDIIVSAKREGSGRLDKCLPIGEYRGHAYRVKEHTLKNWGGLVNNPTGYIQRSARLPEFKEPQRFYDWFERQLSERNIRLIQRNN